MKKISLLIHQQRPTVILEAALALAAGLRLSLMAGLFTVLSACALSSPQKWFGSAPNAAMEAAKLPGNTDYQIGPEDALEISVWKEESLKKEVLVRPDGGISFPLAGDLNVAGKTAAQIQQELTTRIEKFIPDPVVNVAVIKVASYRIYVLGRVNRPGDFTVGRNVDVLQALTMAGGMTPFASEDGIQIIRKNDGKSVAIPFEYSRMRKGEALEQNILLRSGDVVLVP